jgi:hypothetical protein
MCFVSTRCNVSRSRCIVLGLIYAWIAMLSIRLRICAQTASNGYIYIFTHIWTMPFSKHKGMSAKISVCAPRFCTVYAVSKGKLSIRQSDMQTDGNIVDDTTSETSFSSSSSSNYTSTSHSQTGKK